MIDSLPTRIPIKITVKSHFTLTVWSFGFLLALYFSEALQSGTAMNFGEESGWVVLELLQGTAWSCFPGSEKDKDNVSKTCLHRFKCLTQITSLVPRMNVPAFSVFRFYFHQVNIYGHSSPTPLPPTPTPRLVCIKIHAFKFSPRFPRIPAYQRWENREDRERLRFLVAPTRSY